MDDDVPWSVLVEIDIAFHEALALDPDETVAALFKKARRRYGRDARHLEHSRRLVHTALTAPVLLANGDRIAGLWPSDHAGVWARLRLP